MSDPGFSYFSNAASRWRELLVLAALAVLILFVMSPTEADSVKRDYWAVQITGIYDGDTFNFVSSKLPFPLNKMKVRVRGIDTPEIGGRAKCRQEELRAEAAKKKLIEIVGTSTLARLRNFSWDKYGGRIVADVEINGKDVRTIMLNDDLAAPYEGSGAKRDWCLAK